MAQRPKKPIGQPEQAMKNSETLATLHGQYLETFQRQKDRISSETWAFETWTWHCMAVPVKGHAATDGWCGSLWPHSSPRNL